MPKVSVIVPFYNSEDYIGEAIESILKQSYQDYEIIAVNDGSTDSSAEVVERFGSGIRNLSHPNSGVAKTMNRGMEAASGEYLSFLESDDIWHPDKLAVQVEVLDRCPDVGIVTSDVEYIEQDGTKLNKILVASRHEDTFIRMFVKGHILLPSAMMIRREVYEKAGGMNEGFIGACLQDHEWAARLCDTAKIHSINKPLVFYRMHPAKTPSHVLENNTACFIDQMLSRFGSSPEKRRFLIAKRIGFLSDTGKRKVSAGQIEEGRRFFWEAAALSMRNRINLAVLFRTLIRLGRSYL